MVKTWRSKEMEAVYQDFLKSGKKGKLWDEPAIDEGDGWKVIENRFFYDDIASVHHLFLTEKGFDLAKEYATIHGYETVLYNTPKFQTVPDETHYHLIIK